MTFFVYVLANYKKDKMTTYVGYTDNLKRRLKLHNTNRGAKFTRGRHWKIIYYEKYKIKSEAILRECYIKKNRKVRKLIVNQNK